MHVLEHLPVLPRAVCFYFSPLSETGQALLRLSSVLGPHYLWVPWTAVLLKTTPNQPTVQRLGRGKADSYSMSQRGASSEILRF